MRLFEIGVNFFFSSFLPYSCSTANNREEKGFENNKLYQCLSPPCPLCLPSFAPFSPPLFLPLSNTCSHPFSISILSPSLPFSHHLKGRVMRQPESKERCPQSISCAQKKWKFTANETMPVNSFLFRLLSSYIIASHVNIWPRSSWWGVIICPITLLNY